MGADDQAIDFFVTVMFAKDLEHQVLPEIIQCGAVTKHIKFNNELM